MERKERVIGGLILLVSVLTTCVNESRLVNAKRSLEQGRLLAVELHQPVYDPRNEGKLIHFSALITTDGDVFDSEGKKLALRSPFVLDPSFGIAVKGVRLYRDVEMLQWVETSHTSSNSNPEDEDRRFDDERERVYMYDLRWRSERIDSSAFHDMGYWNPPQEAWIYEAKVFKASDVTVGDFKLSDALIDQIERRDAVTLDAATRKTMTNVLSQRLGEKWVDSSVLRNVSIEEDKYFYARQNTVAEGSSEPPVSVLGDLRVSYSVTPAYPVTVCAQQQERSLLPFPTQAGDPIFLLEDGIHTAAELFAVKTEAKFRTNRFYRLFSGVIGFIGFLVVHPLAVARLGGAFARIQKPVLAGSLSCALTFTVVGVNWSLSSPFWAAVMWVGGVTPILLLLAHARLAEARKKE